MKLRIIIVLAVFALIISAATLYAQLIPVLGSQRAGTAMYQFLKIGVGGRAVGMGEAFVAVADDASALFWNPAGIVQSTRNRPEGELRTTHQNEAIFSHVNWPVEVQHEYFGYLRQLGDVSAVGFGITQLHTDDFEETTEFRPLGTGRYVAFGDLALGLTLARKMTDRFSVGFTVKYIDETLAELHARNVLFDFGTYYWTGFGSSRFAVAVVNFGATATPSGNMILRDGTKLTHFQKFTPPTIFRIGFAMDIVDNENHKITTALQLNHPNDNAENVNLGCEYWWRGFVALRGGYRINMDEESFTFGAGLDLPLRLLDLGLDLAYSDFGRLGNATRLTMRLLF